jgi:DNA transposition AAA+ family ATPase
VLATLLEIARGVGAYDQSQRPDELRQMIEQQLRWSNTLLICDEAHHLSRDGLRIVKSLNDRTGAGVVLVGHLDLAENIARLPDVAGRIAAPIRFVSATPKDADVLLDAWGVDDKNARAFLRQLARRPTGLRRIAKAYQLAAILAFGEGLPAPNLSHLRTAVTNLAGSIENAEV